MNKKVIELNDTEIGLQKLPTILNTAIVTPITAIDNMNRHNGALEINTGDSIYIIIMARKTAANPDAYYLDLRVRLSVGCKRRSYFFFLYLPVFSYLRLWYSVH